MEKVFINLEGELPTGIGVIRGVIKSETKHEKEGRFISVITEGAVNMDDIKIANKPKYKENPEVIKSIEFSRYKQDCRKRALDVATTGAAASDFANVEKLADKYYNWLISIPQ